MGGNHSMKAVHFFRFPLRGLHSLEKLGEPTHGHSAHLIIGIRSPFSEELEKEFLCFVKSEILCDFDKRDWSHSVEGEPSGENVVLEIAERFKQNEKFNIQTIKLQETKKNLFEVHF